MLPCQLAMLRGLLDKNFLFGEIIWEEVENMGDNAPPRIDGYFNGFL
jgi:hypothetical protein